MFSWFAAYLVTHALAYLVVFRRLPLFRRESVMFHYHFLPALGVAAVAVGDCLVHPGSESLVRGLVLVSTQGIYSISFLELWGQAQGGYSLHILTRFDSAEGRASLKDLASLQDLGASKQAARLVNLQGLRLIQTDGQRFRLTGRGRVVAAGLGCFAWLANLKQLG